MASKDDLSNLLGRNHQLVLKLLIVGSLLIFVADAYSAVPPSAATNNFVNFNFDRGHRVRVAGNSIGYVERSEGIIGQPVTKSTLVFIGNSKFKIPLNVWIFEVCVVVIILGLGFGLFGFIKWKRKPPAGA